MQYRSPNNAAEIRRKEEEEEGKWFWSSRTNEEKEEWSDDDRGVLSFISSDCEMGDLWLIFSDGKTFWEVSGMLLCFF